MKKSYIQVGAGVGDRDPRVNYRDGFTEYVKARPYNEIGEIILVEPNPLNIPLLLSCWEGYRELIKVHTVGVVVGSSSSSSVVVEQEVKFYYCEEDRPHYQVFSLDIQHVRKHYPEAEIKSMLVPVVSINSILSSCKYPVDILGLDIEGIDHAILMDIDWNIFSCRLLSYEQLHLTEQQHSEIQGRLESVGYCKSSSLPGLDPHGYDIMWERKVIV